MIKYILITILFFTSLYSKNNSTYGLGTSFISAPLYIGSKKTNSYILPFPYIEFKSKYFNVDRNKIYNNLYNSEKVKVEISLRGVLPVESKDSAREGMPNLDPILEFGPKYSYSLYKNNDSRVSLELPLRATFTVGDELFEYKGYTSNINIKYKNKVFNNYKISYTFGLSYNSEKINNYYYEVKPQYTNKNRIEYKTSSGYGGFHNSFAFTKKTKSLWYGAFIKHYYLDGVVFEKSPLYEKNNALFYGFAISYLF
jgi:outer membrane scaffolding protein for murein synthesis (MipA/OmpV family)